MHRICNDFLPEFKFRDLQRRRFLGLVCYFLGNLRAPQGVRESVDSLKRKIAVLGWISEGLSARICRDLKIELSNSPAAVGEKLTNILTCLAEIPKQVANDS